MVELNSILFEPPIISKYSDAPQEKEVVKGQDHLCHTRFLFSYDTRIPFLTSKFEIAGGFHSCWNSLVL
jgi:hypothetical protein